MLTRYINYTKEHRKKMNSNRKIATIIGALYITATAATMLIVGLLVPIIEEPDNLINVSANENLLIAGMLFVFILAVAVGGIGVMFYPILKKLNESMGIGYFATRIIEAVIYILVSIGLLSLLTLSKEFIKEGAPEGFFFQTGGTLIMATANWAFMFSSFVFSLGALILYYLLYKSKLVPRWLSAWGLIGTPLFFAAALFPLFGQHGDSTLAISLGLPMTLQELVLGGWLIVKGFSSSAIDYGSQSRTI